MVKIHFLNIDSVILSKYFLLTVEKSQNTDTSCKTCKKIIYKSLPSLKLN